MDEAVCNPSVPIPDGVYRRASPSPKTGWTIIKFPLIVIMAPGSRAFDLDSAATKQASSHACYSNSSLICYDVNI